MADAGIATHRLKKNALGTGAITFLVVSAAGGGVPAALAPVFGVIGFALAPARFRGPGMIKA